MDTSLENRKITPTIIALYGLCAELVPITANLLYVYVWGNLIHPELNLSFTESYMEDTGVMIFLSIGFLSYLGTAFWIAKRSLTRTFFNSARLVLAGAIVELIFYWIIGVSFEFRYAFSFITYLVAVLIATLTPTLMKGKKTHRKNWDEKKDQEYEKVKRK